MVKVLKNTAKKILWAWAMASFASALIVASHARVFIWEMAIIVVPITASLFAACISVLLGILDLCLTKIRSHSVLKVGIGTLSGTLAGLAVGHKLLETSSVYEPNAPPNLPFWTLAAIVVAGAVAGAVSCSKLEE